jgi:hypothetical protein
MTTEECTLCYERLDVPAFERNTTGDVIIGDTSTRLLCGHAYHTPCLIRSLQHMARCPLCNVLQDQNNGNDDMWRARMQLEGRCQDVLQGVKRSPEVRERLADYRAFHIELTGKHKEFQRRMKEFKGQLREEMGIDRLWADVQKMRIDTVQAFKKEVRKRRNLYQGALACLMKYKHEKVLFGDSPWYFKRKINRYFY